MKKIILALAFSASLTGFAEAQTSRNPCYTTGAQTTQGIPNCIGVGTSTPLPVVTTTTTGAPLDVEGNVASGATDSGNPVKVGGVFNTSPPGVSSGQRVDAQSDANGNLRIRMTGSSTTGADGILNTNLTSNLLSSEGSGGVANRPFINAPYNFNGTTWDRSRSIGGAVAAGTGTQAVAIAPTSSAAGAIKPVVTSAAASSLVLKASAGNLYSVTLTSGASAGLLMVFDATSAPADGAVTPVECINVAANSTVVVNFSPGPPSSYVTGITAVFSTGTNCFNKAASATAFISGKVQ